MRVTSVRIFIPCILLVLSVCMSSCQDTAGTSSHDTCTTCGEDTGLDVSEPVDTELRDTFRQDGANDGRDAPPVKDTRRDDSRTDGSGETDTGDDAGDGCPAGQHRCSGRCVNSSSIRHCGGRCEPCPFVGPAGERVCEDGSCGADCDEGHRLCDGRCVECPSTGEKFDCSEGRCVATECPDGQRVCGGECVRCPSFASETTCGSDGSCRATACETDYHLCDGECRWNGSAASCGQRCTSCPTIPGSEALCEKVDQQYTCKMRCKRGFWPCSSGCCHWSFQNVVGKPVYHSHEIGAQGETHILYELEPPNQSKDASLIYENLSTGTREVLFTADTIPWRFDLELDPQNRPVAFYSTVGGTMHLEVRTSTGWNPLSTPGISSIGTANDIEFESDGTLHLAFGKNPGANQDTQLHYARETANGGWVTEVADTNVSLNKIDLEIRPNGEPVVTYWEPIVQKIKAAKRLGTNAWKVDTVDDNQSRVPYPDITVTPNGDIWVGYEYDAPDKPYQNGKNRDFRVARFNGSKWSINTVDDRRYAGARPELKADSSGKIYAAYHQNTNTRLAIRDPSGTWDSGRIDQPLGPDRISLSLTPADLPTVSYVDSRDTLVMAQ